MWLVGKHHYITRMARVSWSFLRVNNVMQSAMTSWSNSQKVQVMIMIMIMPRPWLSGLQLSLSSSALCWSLTLLTSEYRIQIYKIKKQKNVELL